MSKPTTAVLRKLQAVLGTAVLDDKGKEDLICRILEAAKVYGSSAAEKTTADQDVEGMCMEWYWIPGRIELVGKHTDYCGGESIVFPVNRGFLFAVVKVSPGDDDGNKPEAENKMKMSNQKSRKMTVIHCRDGSPSLGAGEQKNECWSYACVSNSEADSSTACSEEEDGKNIISTASKPKPEQSPPGWSTYFRATWDRLRMNFGMTFTPRRIYFASDLPKASGLSSSSALVVAAFVIVEQDEIFASQEKQNKILSDVVRSWNPEDLAAYLGCCENGSGFSCSSMSLPGSRGVGTFGGSEDHAGILNIGGLAGGLSRLCFMPAKVIDAIKWPVETYHFVVASSGVEAHKGAGSMEHYNNAVLIARDALERINAYYEDNVDKRKFASLGSFLANEGAKKAKKVLQEIYAEVSTAVQWHANAVPGGATTAETTKTAFIQFGRVQQFLDEMEVIEELAKLVKELNEKTAPDRSQAVIEKLASCLQKSQEGSEKYLLNIIEETAYLPRSALKLGAIAASAFGAGFGGSVYAIVPADRSENFRGLWEKDYISNFPQHESNSCFFIVKGPGAGAQRIM
ncbi:unnamed protein product [Amoebophrya sp. A25]|nr:unnamed protein product [Amoebophrya sp. A25]|eukprot:GSA25T00000247001.1